MNQEPGQAAVAIHERVQEDETERDDAGGDQWVDLHGGFVGEQHQLVHQISA
ncbi:hypothetical protein D3C76_1193300 [compost metagenome]